MENLSESIEHFISRHRGVVAVYLFGSQAMGRGRKGSDIDLAIMTAKTISPLTRVKWETELSNLLGHDVDLVIFGQSGVLLRHQILKHGKLLVDVSPKNRVSQEVLARKQYMDSRRLYRKITGTGTNHG